MKEYKEYQNAVQTIQGLSDEEIEQLVKFANGIDTVKDLPEKLAAIAIEILKQRHLYCMALLRQLRE